MATPKPRNSSESTLRWLDAYWRLSVTRREWVAMSDLAAALMVAIRVHAAQTDLTGSPYLLHVLRVVEAVSDDKVVAALHDVIEDGGLSLSELEGACSLSESEALALDLLTRQEGETYTAYIDRLADESAANWSAQYSVLAAREVKLADLRDNLGRIPREPTTGYPIVGPEVAEREAWAARWGGLKERYERAIAVLEGV